jgi:hypothetical protein
LSAAFFTRNVRGRGLLFFLFRRSIGHPKTPMDMKARHIVQFAFGLLLIALANGCATRALWQNGALEAWRQPAGNPNLHLFETKPPGNLLVVYDEYSERHDANRTRAYWLKENQKLIADRHMPHFVSANSAGGLNSIPVFSPATNQFSFPPVPYAIVSTNGQSFTVHSGNGAITSYDLPCYNDGKGKVEKFVLTPAAVTADATIVGGFLGMIYLEARCGGPIYPFYPDN